MRLKSASMQQAGLPTTLQLSMYEKLPVIMMHLPVYIFNYL